MKLKLFASVFVLAFAAAACGSSDCEDGCERASDLCGIGSVDIDECVDICEDFADDVQEAAADCVDEASSCNEVIACLPDFSVE